MPSPPPSPSTTPSPSPSRKIPPSPSIWGSPSPSGGLGTGTQPGWNAASSSAAHRKHQRRGGPAAR
ncbi:MAG: hypothetical protein GC168_15235 [Candidatus Hydrogenedens sp.]|nr:hypothetical protein [Candidatus Hydrogenedens sp.]